MLLLCLCFGCCFAPGPWLLDHLHCVHTLSLPGLWSGVNQRFGFVRLKREGSLLPDPHPIDNAGVDYTRLRSSWPEQSSNVFLMYSKAQHALVYAWHIFLGTPQNRELTVSKCCPCLFGYLTSYEENNSTGIEKGHKMGRVTRILMQVNATETAVQHLCCSSIGRDRPAAPLVSHHRTSPVTWHRSRLSMRPRELSTCFCLSALSQGGCGTQNLF